TVSEKVHANAVSASHHCPQISIFTIEGPLFFGVAQLFEQRVMESIHYKPEVLILRMGKVPFMDSTGEANFLHIIQHFKKNGGIVLLSGMVPRLEEQMKLSGLYEEIGKDNIFEHTGEAIDFALTNINYNRCLGCRH